MSTAVDELKVETLQLKDQSGKPTGTAQVIKGDPLHHGKRHGPERLLHENGSMRSEGNYTLGKADGQFVEYYKNGQVSVERTFEGGEPVGVSTNYYEDGTVLSTEDHESGIRESFDREGQSVELSRFDRKAGILEQKTASGTIFMDKKNDIEQRFRPDGSREMYIDKKNGLAESYYPDGTVQERRKVKQGGQVAEIEMYHPNGNIAETCSMDMKQGTLTPGSAFGHAEGPIVRYDEQGLASGAGWKVDNDRSGRAGGEMIQKLADEVKYQHGTLQATREQMTQTIDTLQRKSVFAQNNDSVCSDSLPQAPAVTYDVDALVKAKQGGMRQGG